MARIACLPYGIGHFTIPFVVATFLWLFCTKQALHFWARSFGNMNMVGVIIQILLPCSAPWYELIHGLTDQLLHQGLPRRSSSHRHPLPLQRVSNAFDILPTHLWAVQLAKSLVSSRCSSQLRWEPSFQSRSTSEFHDDSSNVFSLGRLATADVAWNPYSTSRCNAFVNIYQYREDEEPLRMREELAFSSCTC